MPALDLKICVIGLGYIGLPTASLLGTKGFYVHGVDTSQEVVDTINAGGIHIVEPDLDILVKSAVQSGRLSAGLEPVEADVFIIAVPTPFKHGETTGLVIRRVGNTNDLSLYQAGQSGDLGINKPGWDYR